MNTFEISFYIDDKPYNLYIDSSKDDWKRIVINNQEIFNEEYTLSLNRHAYIIYYPINIAENELVIAIDDRPLKHIYNVFLNGTSLLDGTQLNENYLKANKLLDEGFKNFLKNNWLKILVENILALISCVVTFALMYNYSQREFNVKFLLVFIIVPLALPAFIAGEWFHTKNIVRKFKNCFRPKQTLDSKTR